MFETEKFVPDSFRPSQHASVKMRGLSARANLQDDTLNENVEESVQLMREQMLALYKNESFPDQEQTLEWYAQRYKQNNSIPVFDNFDALPLVGKYAQLAFVTTKDHHKELRLFLMRVRPEIDKVWQVIRSVSLDVPPTE